MVEGARITDTTIEIFHAPVGVSRPIPTVGIEAAVAATPEHMHEAHTGAYARGQPAPGCCRLQLKSGREQEALVGTIVHTKPHPEQGFRACLGILRLAKTYGEARLEAACQRGLTIGARTYGSVASILRTGLDRAFHDDVTPEAAPLLHANIRGRGYYH